ncbi:Short-chain alcohol dehydrogenase [Frankia canadensis]|uniref:Short-chain alcohol dehydrogenase n=1 Tax=Frankia canadensis TaxID=1836972 RepID=A0A2I2L0T0_9ACTN|nr:Short-chain alcohol dehydrogenase [Frankia canadensis]SOU58823.1 Short-chain alcohol dehydrogenase [Frankia canadensis]
MAGARLAGRTAIVTGASRGLGRAIALAFAREGAAVAVVARTEAQWNERLPGTVHEVVDEIESTGGRAVAVPADLARPEDVERVVEVTHDRLGPVDILINNAALTVPGRPSAARAATGNATANSTASATSNDAANSTAADSTATAKRAKATGDWASFVNFPLKGFRMHFEIGLFASYRLMQLTLPDMIERGGGAIVTISSYAAFMPGEGPYAKPGSPGPIAYGGNKAALHHLTSCVAVEAQAYGIAVNALAPSEPVLTPGTLGTGAEETDWASPESFAEATLRAALADPATTNGQLLWSDDLLHPELGRRGWLRGD